MKNQTLDYFTKRIKTLTAIRSLYRTMLSDPQYRSIERFDRTRYFGESGIHFEADSVEALTAIRQFLRTYITPYEDKVYAVFVSGDGKCGIATYKPSPLVEVWLRMPITDFPILKPGCGFRQVVETVPHSEKTSWVYSCSTPETESSNA